MNQKIKTIHQSHTDAHIHSQTISNLKQTTHNCPLCKRQYYHHQHYHPHKTHQNLYTSSNHSLSIPINIHNISPSKPIYPYLSHNSNIYSNYSSYHQTFSPIVHYQHHSESNLLSLTNNTPNHIRLKKKPYYHHHVSPPKFAYSKFSLEIRCPNLTSQKNNEDLIQKVSSLENKLNQKETYINILLNNIIFLENQLKNYRKENENLKHQTNSFLRKSNKIDNNNYLESIIKQLKKENTHLEMENKNLKLDNVTLYQMVHDKQQIQKIEVPPIQPIFIQKNFLNNLDNDKNEKNKQRGSSNIEVSKTNYNISNIELFRGNEEISIITSDLENENGESNYIDSDINYHKKLNEIKKHIANLNGKKLSSQNSNSDNKLTLKNENVKEHANSTANLHKETNKIILTPLFTLYDNKRVLCFDPETKTFSLIEFIDLSKNFETSYKKEGSLYLSINNSLYIITGSYFDTLYYFNLNERTLKKVNHLNHNHCYGGFIFLHNIKQFLCISGTSNKYIETCNMLSSHKRSNSNVNNIFSTYHWNSLENELTVERSQSMFIVQNQKYIFSFFGFCYPQNKYLNTIEYCEIEYNKIGNWKLIEVNSNVENISLYLKGHFIFEKGTNQDKEEGLILIGGLNGNKGETVLNYIEIGLNEEKKMQFRKLKKNIVDVDVNSGYCFNMGIPACTFSKSYGSILVFDQKFNVHVVNREELSHDIYYFQ